MKHDLPGARLLALTLTLALSLIIPALIRPTLAAQSYQNAATISFNDATGSGPAALYPSPITVAGLEGSITKVAVTLTNISHNFPDAVDILLVGPDGKQVVLMSDVGGAAVLSGVTLTLADGAPALPNDTAISSGTYRPTNQPGADSFPTPGPGTLTSGNTLLSIFNLTDPNGSWNLFAVEDGTGSTGAIGGWSLSIETADLVAEVASTPATVNAGAPLAYDVTLRNRGTEPVANPLVTIGIPAGTSFSSVTPPVGWSCPAPAAGATSFTCTTASFASGAAPVIAVSVLVDQALAPGTNLSRTVAISSTVAEANSTNNSASTDASVTTLADLQVVAVDSPASVDAGAELAITVDVRNNGPSNAANASVTIPVPASTTFVSLASPAGWACTTPAVGAAGDVVCTSGVFSTTTASFTLRVKADTALAPGASLASSASVTAETADSATGNNSGADTTTVTTSTNLAVEIADAPDPVSAAANLTYTILVTNNGPSNAATATMTSEVRTGTTFVALVAPEGWSCTTPVVGGVGAISCTNPSFGVTSQSFTLTVQVLSGTPLGSTLSLTAVVATGTADSDGANNSDTETTTVTVAADLSVALDGVGVEVKRGTTLAYNLRVNNSGPEPAESVTLTSAIPAGTSFVSLVSPAGWVCMTPAVGATGAISCTNDALDVTTDVLVLSVQLGGAPDGTAVALTASVQSPTVDGDPANNSAALNSVVVAPFRSFLPLLRR